MKINNRLIGPGQPCYVIAELSANHGGSLDHALAIVRGAKAAGADAVKIQTYTADTMTLDVKSDLFRVKGGLWDGQYLYELYQKASTPWEWHAPIKEEAEKSGLHFFSTPFDETAVDFLEKLNVPAYKIASFELIDDPLLIRIGQTKKPVIMSTGMASLEEIRHALDLLHAHGSSEVALLKCVSAYPAPADHMHLRTIPDMQQRFKCPVGLSDHTLGHIVPVTGVALGAQLLEKHVKLNAGDDSVDAAFSMTLEDFGQMVQAVRLAELAMGQISYSRIAQESESFAHRRSIFCSRDIKKGEIFTKDNIRVVRPGQGLSPKFYGKVLGTRAKEDIGRGKPLSQEMVDG